MKRSVLLFGLCLALLLGLFASPASAEEADWVEAYEQILDQWAQRLAAEPVEYSSQELWYPSSLIP